MHDIIDNLSVVITMSAITEVSYRVWNYHFDMEHSDTRIFRILEGGGVYRCGSTQGEFVPGRMYLLPSNTDLSFHTADRVKLSWTHLDLLWRKELNLFNLVVPRAVEWHTPGQEMARRFDEIPDLWRGGCPERLRALSTVYELLGVFWELADFAIPAGQDRRLRRLQRALRLIDGKLAGGVSVTELASAAGMGESQFFAEFKTLLGVTPARYVLLRRLERARQMLAPGQEHKLQAVAEACGFSDAFHLSKTFKREYRISPRDYRKLVPLPQP